jgi:hypothetical protein
VRAAHSLRRQMRAYSTHPLVVKRHERCHRRSYEFPHPSPFTSIYSTASRTISDELLAGELSQNERDLLESLADRDGVNPNTEGGVVTDSLGIGTT